MGFKFLHELTQICSPSTVSPSLYGYLLSLLHVSEKNNSLKFCLVEPGCKKMDAS